MVRSLSLFCIALFTMACAHTATLTPRQRVADTITTAYVRVHTYSSYEILECESGNTECRPLGLQITTSDGIGSGGIVKHYESYSVIMTAAHVVSSLNTLPSGDVRTQSNVIRAFSEIVGMPLRDASILFQAGRLQARGIESKVTAVASDGNEYEVNAGRCHPNLDLCFIRTIDKIEGIRPLTISDQPPIIGDNVFCAQGPFGYAIPGMMVPLFEGIYSGKTPEATGTPPQDYYTFPVAPGSSGSLIVNQQGEVVGLVTSFMYGPLCSPTGCQAFSSGITVSVPFTDIQQFFNQLLTLNQGEK